MATVHKYLSVTTRRDIRSTHFHYATLFRSGYFARRDCARRRLDRDAGPRSAMRGYLREDARVAERGPASRSKRDRKSTRLNSSHVATSYAVFCLKKKMY